MRMVDLIHQKKLGNALSEEEIGFMIRGFTEGDIPDYQMAAFCMAVFFKGMEDREIASLTSAMARSGDLLDLSGISGKVVDKHSTGGVGDKTTLIVAPLVAAAGVPVAKMSGRGLGNTGGTIDKLQAIEGFQVELTIPQFIHQVNNIQLALAGQTGNLAPADKKMYALRDVTDTVNSIPLIASSVMSKKIASGADGIVLDVKVGSGAFMKSIGEAKRLAEQMVAIGKNLGRETVALITDMNQPLGYEIGNANEVKEAIDVLRGRNVEDLRTLSITLAAHMTVIAGRFSNTDQACEELERILDSGLAFDAFLRFVKAQGGDAGMVENPRLLPQARYHRAIIAPKAGYIQAMDTDKIGLAAMMSGAGRKKKEDSIDYAAGITLNKKLGDWVDQNEPLCVLHSNAEHVPDAEKALQEAFTVSAEAVPKTQLIYDVVTSAKR
ncbi:pyrimidine-nucleoside phosphorylase [Cohnella cellulosilytica]|uniref:Pyrimidine-nucleoside phosphorylase n=1 Tax=Cohnella cellulosilytica TaxID=986710 RepID=A0ABW2F6J3_9BACL